MAGRKSAAPVAGGSRRASARLRSSAAKIDDVVPDVVREMLAEAGGSKRKLNGSAETSSPQPLKRKRPGEGNVVKSARAKLESRKEPEVVVRDDEDDEDDVEFEDVPLGESARGTLGSQKVPQAVAQDDDDDDDDDIEFEDVPLPKPTVQTMMRDSEDEEDDDEIFEDVVDFSKLHLQTPTTDAPPMDLNLNLTATQADMGPQRRSVDRRKALNKEEKQRRVEVHKIHVLCLIFHVSMRNRWCNDKGVQAALRPLLTAKMIKYLNPPSNLSQFGRTESLKNGLQEVATMWKVKFTVTERGMRRALWAEDEAQLQSYELPDDIESTLTKSDFLDAAKTLQGSRDVGAQLFCALLRSAGVKTRLVCSLQALACVPSAPTMPKQRTVKLPTKPSRNDLQRRALAVFQTKQEESTGIPSARRRLGHPNAAGYNIPIISSPSSSSRQPEPPATKRIRNESDYPIYWVEVLDVAHQKWAPVDPLVTSTQWKPKPLEPPASDRENSMSYVLAFESDGSAKDVTCRYVKAYNSKTRKQRIDGILGDQAILTAGGGRPAGERWWRRTMKIYAKPHPTDTDQIEDVELQAAEAKETMPRNVADFKDHPVYALERHLRRNEVLVPGAQPAGTVGAGSKGLLERIYRRRDVRVARTRERWYRLGREVKAGEEPVKILPKKRVRKRGRFEESEEEDDDDPNKVGLFGDENLPGGSPLYMFEQTDLYIPLPVVNGRVPKNKFGNLDIYVPSMVPKGGAYIAHERARQAAHICGVDYAPALTGFQFKGKKGTAVLHGAVVPIEAEEGVRAVVAGLEDLDEELGRERRRAVALRMWSRMLKGLRIRERIWANVEDEDETGGQMGEDKGKGVAKDDAEEEMDVDEATSDVTEEMDFVDDDEGGGGFLVDDDDDAGGGGGGFMIE
jgi:xeroderma pigmentosum group C-complementing protein